MNFDIRRIFGWTPSSTVGGTVDPGFFAPVTTRDEVSIESAEENMAVYRAIRLVSGDMATMPVTSSGGLMTEELLRQPNSKETWYSFVMKHQRNVMLYGNSFALISMNGYGIVELISCAPFEVTQINVDKDPSNFVYNHAIYGPVQPEDILHFRTQSRRPFWGASPVLEGIRALNLAVTQENAGQQMYMTPGLGKVAIESPEAIGPEMVAKLQEAFKAKHAGKDGHLLPIITQGGMSVSQVGQSLSDSDWITARSFSIREVCRMYSVPPAFLFDMEAATLENSAAQMRSYVSTCLAHWVAQFSTEFQFKLGSELNFNFNGLLRGTLKEQTEALRMAVDAGIITGNEAREQLGMEPHPDADQLMISKNYAEAGVNGSDTDAGDDKPQEAPDKD